LGDDPAQALTRIKAQFIGVDYHFTMREEPLLPSQGEKIVSLPAETRFAPNGIVSRTVFTAPGTRVVLFGFAPGQELTEHTSTQHALVQVLSGRCEFTLAGQSHPLKAGDLLHMPPGLPHAVRATEEFSMLLTLAKPAELAPLPKIVGLK
jgi:quercetin dioxygenase-like cupin family protein